MSGFVSWLYGTLGLFFGGLWRIIKNFALGIFDMFNIVKYINLFAKKATDFNTGEWILAIITFLLFLVLISAIIYSVVLVIRKIVRYHRVISANEDLLCELSDLHRDVARLTQEKEQIINLSMNKSALTPQAIDDIEKKVASDLALPSSQSEDEQPSTTETPAVEETTPIPNISNSRFYRLCAVDEKHNFEIVPHYENNFSLSELCDNFRNFACSRMGLFYEIKTIRLMFAGLSSTKLILLQGISGTGKTSLPYAMGKFFRNDATIASVQPSWRDRTELFGYFNEFTKKFNETEVLKRIYESSYNDDINVIILDEMNIARVEYYFAEMLSILEMPDPKEWKISLVPNYWEGDPVKLKDGQLLIPQNIWYVGTANNDDSTFSISDKFYDRAFTINLDNKGIPFEAKDVPPTPVSYSYVDSLYQKAINELPVSKDILSKIEQLDNYIIAHFRVAFGNRIMKQLKIFVPVYQACGGEDVEGVDYILATKVIRKFESLNSSLIRDEIDPLINYLNKLFGKNAMKECISYLKRIKKMY